MNILLSNSWQTTLEAFFLLLQGQLQSTVSAKRRLPPHQRKARAHWNNYQDFTDIINIYIYYP